jgi:hypothetical protein
MGMAAVTSVKLDKDRLLFYGTVDLIEAERRMGKGFYQALEDRTMGDLVTMLWAGLKHQEAKLTIEGTAKVLDVAKRNGTSSYLLWNKIVDALTASGVLPESDQAQPPDPTSAPSP